MCQSMVTFMRCAARNATNASKSKLLDHGGVLILRIVPRCGCRQQSYTAVTPMLKIVRGRLCVPAACSAPPLRSRGSCGDVTVTPNS